MLRALITVLAVALLPLAAAAAEDAGSAPVYAPRSGDALPPGAAYPTKKKFESLTPAERAGLRALYDGMAEADEPPFPKAGMAPIMGDVAELAGVAKVTGIVSIFVNVDAAGNATGVRVMKAPNIDVAKAISFILVQAKYKPAVCGGAPCAMEFPFRFNLTL
jgi:hypothetical protein